MTRTLSRTVLLVLAVLAPASAADLRDISTGLRIPDEGYCDQPYVVITQKGEWLCTLTTGSGLEGQGGQHVVSTISSDQGRTWSPLVDIEPSSGPAASWVVPVVTPTGRVYVFYTYNGDNVKLGRDDVHGWYAMKYSDDHGKSWSPHRFRLPLRRTACDQLVKDGQLIQMFWGIDKPKIADGTLYFAFTKLGRYFLEEGEGWLFASSNFLSVTDPNDVQWQVRPVGDHGIRRASYGTTQEEHNLVPLGGERLYCVYRTTMGYPCHCYSEDGGRTWTVPEPMTYSPKGRVVRTPRACPKLWRCANGKYLFWYHFHGGPNYAGQYPQAGGLNFDGRNPAWIIGGIVKDGRLHWSQPEILLYDEDPQVRMSYPDLIEQDGRYWVTETQKSIARIHEIDAQLLQGTWAQLEETPPNDPVTSGCVVDWTAEELESTVSENAPRVTLDVENGFTLDLWLTIKHFIAGQVLLDTRDEAGRGWAVSAAEKNTLSLTISDGQHQGSWDCDPEILTVGEPHHVVFVVDGGPHIITVLIDGEICDGGTTRQFGWGRFAPEISDISGTGRIKTNLTDAQVHRLRIYDRHLRTAEVVQNHRAGR
jgi:hypothetical protein